MLRCRRDTNGVVGLTLSQIGLFLATGVLLTVVLSFVFFNDWQRTAELRSLSSDFSHFLEDLQSIFFEESLPYQFKEKNYEYRVRLSMDYIALSAEGSWGVTLHVTERFFVQPWPRHKNQSWISGDELHSYLNGSYGHFGTPDDPLSTENFSQLLNDFNTTMYILALHPYEVDTRTPVIVEKVMVCYGQDDKHDFLLLYQTSPIRSTVSGNSTLSG